jgi:hypothetical protein
MHRNLPLVLAAIFVTEAVFAAPLVVQYPNRKEAISVKAEISQDGTTHVWALNEAGAIRYRYNQSANALAAAEKDEYNPGRGILDARVNDVIVDEECNLFTTASSGFTGCRIFATGSGLSLYIRSGDIWQNYQFRDSSSIPQGQVRTMRWLYGDIDYVEQSGATTTRYFNEILVGTRRAGMARCQHDKMSFNSQGIATKLDCDQYNTNNYTDFPDNSVNDFEMDPYGRLWVATGIAGVTASGYGGIGVAIYDASADTWDWDWTQGSNRKHYRTITSMA